MPLEHSRVFKSTSKSFGAAFQARSLDLDGAASPLLAVDDFRVASSPFRPHPHAGFSAVTYVFPDSPASLRNRDSLGGDVTVSPGGICWFEAGRGAIHEELAAPAGVELRGLQFFVNLSAAGKRLPPRTLALAGEQVPTWNSADGGAVVRVVVGAYEGVISPLLPTEPFTLLDVTLTRAAAWTCPVLPGCNAVLYVRQGEVHVTGGDTRVLAPGTAPVEVGPPSLATHLPANSLAVANGRALCAPLGNEAGAPLLLRAVAGAKIVVFAGAPLVDPVFTNGPFAMTSEADLREAVARFHRGDMGHLDAASSR